MELPLSSSDQIPSSEPSISLILPRKIQMESYWTRLSYLITVTLTGMFCCGCWTYSGGKLQELGSSLPKANIESVVPSQYGKHGRFNIDAAILDFNVQADLQNIFTWSTNILYVSIVAKYKTQFRPENEVIVWDRVIKSKSKAKFFARDKARLQDYSRGHLHGQNITMVLRCFQFPKTGFLHKRHIGNEYPLVMPQAYTVRGRVVHK